MKVRLKQSYKNENDVKADIKNILEVFGIVHVTRLMPVEASTPTRFALPDGVNGFYEQPSQTHMSVGGKHDFEIWLKPKYDRPKYISIEAKMAPNEMTDRQRHRRDCVRAVGFDSYEITQMNMEFLIFLLRRYLDDGE